jgi:hypothetical protein
MIQKQRTSRLILRQKATATPNATPSNKGKSSGKNILAAAAPLCCQKNS